MSAVHKKDDYHYECHATKKMLTENEFLDKFDAYCMSEFAMADFGCLNIIHKKESSDPFHKQILAKFKAWTQSDSCIDWFRSKYTLWVMDHGQLRKPRG